MVFYLGFAICIFGMLFVTYKTFDSRNILSPQMFVFAGLLLFLYVPAIANKYPYVLNDHYNLLLLFGVLGSLFASSKVSYDVLRKDKEQFHLKTDIFKYLAFMYVLILCYEIVEKIMVMGSISAVFLNNRLEAYLGENLSSTSPFRSLFFTGFKICFYIYVDYLFCNGKTRNALFLFMFPLLHHLFTANTRYDFVAMSGALIIYYMNRRMYRKRIDVNGNVYEVKSKFNFWKIIIIGFIVIYFTLIFMRAANLVRHGLSLEDMEFSYSTLFLDTFSNDSKYYEFLYDLYNKLDVDNFEYGYTWFIDPFINFIPRTIWPDKPYTSFSVRGTELVYYDYTSGNPVYTFTILGEGYAQLGILGCFLSPLIFLISRSITFKQMNRIKYHQLYSLILLFSLLTYMRAESPIFWVLIEGIWIILIKKYLMIKTA